MPPEVREAVRGEYQRLVWQLAGPEPREVGTRGGWRLGRSSRGEDGGFDVKGKKGGEHTACSMQHAVVFFWSMVMRQLCLVCDQSKPRGHEGRTVGPFGFSFVLGSSVGGLRLPPFPCIPIW